ncbi:MAG: hypothetical protein IPM95_04820 [Sphingobacteriales bacterium]|nr:hypothetical protein [Sphingobacteriales bacterium]
MKSCILVLFTLMFNVSFSQGENDILRIRTMTEYVNTHLGDFKKASLKTAGPADAEKKEIEIYTSEPNTIRLITETYPSETGKTIIRDYLENGEPYFVLKEYYTYNVPITDTKFDIQKSEKKEVSYFF